MTWNVCLIACGWMCSQGKTVEVGRAYFETEKSRFTILDAPVSSERISLLSYESKASRSIFQVVKSNWFSFANSFRALALMDTPSLHLLAPFLLCLLVEHSRGVDS